MPRFRLTIDSDYRHIAEDADDARQAVRVIVQPSHRRTTRRTFMMFGALTVLLLGGAAAGLLR